MAEEEEIEKDPPKHAGLSTEEQIAAFIGQAAANVIDRYERFRLPYPTESQLGAGILEIMMEYGYEIVSYNK